MLKIFIQYLLIVATVYSNYGQTLEEHSNQPPSESNEVKDITSVLNQFLPKPLLSITIDQTSKKQLIQVMGKPNKTDNEQNYFYNLSGKNYDTTIGIKNNKVYYILYSPPAGSLSLKELKPYIEPSILHHSTHLIAKLLDEQ